MTCASEARNRSAADAEPFAAADIGAAQGPQKPEGLDALRCILLHFQGYVEAKWHFKNHGNFVCKIQKFQNFFEILVNDILLPIICFFSTPISFEVLVVCTLTSLSCLVDCGADQ